MNIYLTELYAQDPRTTEVKKFCGPPIKALSWGLAEEWCRINAPYLIVIGKSTEPEDQQVETAFQLN